MSRWKSAKARFNYRVAGVCIHNSHVLLHCWEDCAFWALPGGRVELEETSRDALAREMLEETGMEVEVGRLLWLNEYFYTHNEVHFHELGFYYLVTLSEQSALATTYDDFTGHENEMPIFFRWFPIASLPELILHPAFLRTALAKLPTTTEHIIYTDPD